jgi:hypothetical protein
MPSLIMIYVLGVTQVTFPNTGPGHCCAPSLGIRDKCPKRIDRLALTRYPLGVVSPWSHGRGGQLTELGMRITYLAPPPGTEESAPDCDFAVPFH